MRNFKISSDLIFFYYIQQELCARNVILGLSTKHAYSSDLQATVGRSCQHIIPLNTLMEEFSAAITQVEFHHHHPLLKNAAYFKIGMHKCQFSLHRQPVSDQLKINYLMI